MYLLDISQYETIKSMFESIPGCHWNISVMENKNFGNIYVNSKSNPTIAFIENPYLLYYIAGDFDVNFLKAVKKHIVTRLLPQNQENLFFLFSDSNQWKLAITECFESINVSQIGSFVTRRIYHLDYNKYSQYKKQRPSLPANYNIEKSINEDEINIKILYKDAEVCHCRDGGQGLGVMDFELFTQSEHRKKGLAQIASSVLIDYCLEHDVMPQWGCWTMNVPSCKLAEKLGFKIIAEADANIIIVES